MLRKKLHTPSNLGISPSSFNNAFLFSQSYLLLSTHSPINMPLDINFIAAKRTENMLARLSNIKTLDTSITKSRK